ELRKKSSSVGHSQLIFFYKQFPLRNRSFFPYPPELLDRVLKHFVFVFIFHLTSLLTHLLSILYYIHLRSTLRSAIYSLSSSLGISASRGRKW
ncbi:hypothetical protein M514_10023, partial [Trichuris suis]